MSNTTILYDDCVTAGVNAAVEGSYLWLTPADMVAATGWKLESQGLCRGDAWVRTQVAWTDATDASI